MRRFAVTQSISPCTMRRDRLSRRRKSKPCARTREKYSAATLAVPVKDTIKVAAADGTVCATPESTLRAIQTPQVFRLSLYKALCPFAKNAGKQYTDDCQLIEAAGGKVYLTPGDYKNIKITTPEDLLVAEALRRKSKGVLLCGSVTVMTYTSL